MWPDTFVDEANIAFNIQQVRKCLNDDARNPRYVGTVARRGYRFLADVEVVSNDQTPETAVDRPTALTPGATKDGRKRITVFAAATLVVLIGAILIAWSFSRRKEAVENKTSHFRLEQLTATGQSKLVALSPDGK